MKKVFFILSLVITPALFAQGLSEAAQKLKDSGSPLYENIKRSAVDEWKSDHEMIVYEINNQVEAFVEVTTIMETLGNNPSAEKQAVFVNSYKKWSSDGDVSNAAKATVDWEMVLYEMKNQFEAMNEY